MSPATQTAVKMRYVNKLDFPAITICNLAEEVPLSQLSCGTYKNSNQCDAQFHAKQSNCLVYNNERGEEPEFAKNTGLADTLMIVLKINLLQYKENARFSGVYVNLHQQCDSAKNECPDTQVAR